MEVGRCPMPESSASCSTFGANLLEVRHQGATCRLRGCCTSQQDLTAQDDGLSGLGVEADRTYVDHGLTFTNREHEPNP